MATVSYTCSACMRIFLQEDLHVPRHLDALMGYPCPASGSPVESCIVI